MSTYEPRSLELELKFSNNEIPSPVLSGVGIKGERGASIEVTLFDGVTGRVVSSGPEASAEVKIVVLDGDFNSDNWTTEVFCRSIVKEWKRKKSLLARNVNMNLKRGIGSLDVAFKHDRNWLGKNKFRLGAMLVKNFNAENVKEARTEPFVVKDRRNELDKKDLPPVLMAKVMRLKNIGKTGYLRLEKENITTVKNFLAVLFSDREKLQEIYGSHGKRWNVTVTHARTCTEKMVCYPSSSEPQVGVVFNASGELLGLLNRRDFVRIDRLSDIVKANACKSIKVSASGKWDNASIYSNNLSNPTENYNMLDAPNGHNFEAPDMISQDYLHPLPSSSLDSIYSSNLLTWDTEHELSPWFPEPLNNIIHDPNFSVEDQDDYTGDNIQPHHPNQGDMALRRWTKLSRVWFSMKRFVTKMGRAGIHVQKKLRWC